MNSRRCPRCHCNRVIRHGKQCGQQRYYCKDCHCSFKNKPRIPKVHSAIIYHYAVDDMKVRGVAKLFGLHPNTIRNIIHQFVAEPVMQKPRLVSVIMDTTYFKEYGLLLAIDPNADLKLHENKVLYYAWLDHTERTLDYETATDTILAMGYRIISITIDGRRGVKEILESKDIPVQYCQFHQLMTVTQCLTKHPKLKPHQQLRDIAMTITRTDLNTFATRLDNWHLEYVDWLKERYVDEQGYSRYRHARCRRAYFSLRRNLPNLFTYQTDETNRTHNTTSPLDGYFGNLKDKLKVHRGMTNQLKLQLLLKFFSGTTE